MDDNRKHQDTDFSEDDMRLLYALGEATGDLPSAGETQSAWAAFEAKHRTDSRPRPPQPQARNMGTDGGCRRGDSSARDALAAA